MRFFTSPEDLEKWVKNQESPDSAVRRLAGVIGGEKQQDIVDTCENIFGGKDSLVAAKVLYQILAKYNMVEIREANMENKMIKEAQAVMRSDSLYGNMDLRICPKLPKQSAGQGIISTYNCRHYCLDSIVLDEDPKRVYCAEALWRRHVMDKFSREFKDKDGKWVGGYINERFQVNHDSGGNQMELAHGERTRLPRPHQYSTEARLEESRGGEAEFIKASNNKTVKLAATEEEKNNIYQMFSDMIEMKSSGLNDEDIILKVSEHYKETIPAVAQVYKLALGQLTRHDKIVYAYDKNSMIKKADLTFLEKYTVVSIRDVDVVSLKDGVQTKLLKETPVVIESHRGDEVIMEIVDGPDSGKKVKLVNAADIRDAFAPQDEAAEGNIQETAEEVGLNGDTPSAEVSDDFPVVEK